MRLKKAWRPVLLAAGVVVAFFELRGHLPSPAAIWTQLREASPAWFLAAAVAQFASMYAFSEQQRQLLAGFGVRMRAVVSVGMSYARSAMTTALPAGSAISAGYAFKQFRAHGADESVAAAVMLLSGVASVVGLGLLYASAWYPLTAAAIGIAALVWALRRGPITHAAQPIPATTRGRLGQLAALAGAVPGRQWARVVVLAAINWLCDLACLLAAIHAVGLTLAPQAVATAYLAMQLVRQIPLTPGGIGVIEASLILALTAAGATQVPAAAAVLIYRLISSWTIIPIGLACLAAQRWTGRSSESLINTWTNRMRGSSPRTVRWYSSPPSFFWPT